MLTSPTHTPSKKKTRSWGIQSEAQAAGLGAQDIYVLVLEWMSFLMKTE